MDFTDNREVYYPIEAQWQSEPYRIHKYWGRKPWNIVSTYIRKYTEEGGIVLDPYVGSGTTAYEAIRARRKIIAFDINPVATFITRSMLEPVNTFDYELAFAKIQDEVKREIDELYLTRCTQCGADGIVREVIWQRDGEEEIPIQITFDCPSCYKRNVIKKQQEIGKEDVDLLRNIGQLQIPFWYPRSIEVRAHVKTHRPCGQVRRDIHEFFSHRNIIALSYLKSAIDSLNDGHVKNMMYYAFSACLAHSSKLISIKQGIGPGTWKGSSWIVPGLYVLRRHCERNVWYNFEIKFKKILKTKTRDYKDTVFYKPAYGYKDLLEGKGTAWIETRSADQLEDIPDNTISLVFADPPYYEDIQYTDQSALFSSWLKMDNELTKRRDSELTLNPKIATERQKPYYEMLQAQFSQIQRRMALNGKAVVAFESADPGEWDGIVKSMLNSGMKCESIIFHPQRGSFGKAYRYSSNGREVAKQPTLGAYYMKLVPDKGQLGSIYNSIRIDREINRGVLNIIRQRGEPTPLITILLHLYSVLPKELLVSLPTSLVECIRSIRNADFIVKGSLVFMKDGKHTSYTTPSLSERVKQMILRIVMREGIVSSAKINSLLVPFFTGADTVDYSYIGQKILEMKSEGYIEQRDHVFYPQDKLIDKNIEHTQALFYLGEIGRRFSLGVWIGEKNHKYSHNDVNLGALCTIDQRSAEDILKNNVLTRDVDVIWLDGNRPIYSFEVQQEYEGIPQEVVQRSGELLKTFGDLRQIIVGSRHLCDIIRTQEGSWGYYDCLTFENLENYFHKKNATKQLVGVSVEDKLIYEDEVEVIHKGCDYLEREKNRRAKHCTLRLHSPTITKTIRPGQFVAVSCSPSSEIRTQCLDSKAAGPEGFNVNQYKDIFLLRRPFSVHRIYYSRFNRGFLKNAAPLPADFLAMIEGGYKDSFDILFKIVGRGTERLADLRQGEKISVLGPLGNGISNVPLNTETCYLVAGGIGVAPLYAVAEHLRWLGIRVKLIAGGEEHLPLEHYYNYRVDAGVEAGYADDRVDWLAKEFQEIGCEVHTVLASKGEGTAVEKFLKILDDDIRNGRLRRDSTRIYTCGPSGMLQLISKVANQEQIECEVMLEKRMGCCIGTCLSCVCETFEKENGKFSDKVVHKRVCHDGPVFNAKEVKW